MTNITSEFLIWKNILKSNYQKGIKAFENILNNPYEIEKFIESQGALENIFGIPEADGNSNKLIELLQNSPYYDNAIENYLLKELKKNTLADFTQKECEDLLKSNILSSLILASNIRIKIFGGSLGLNINSISSWSNIVTTDIIEQIKNDKIKLNFLLKYCDDDSLLNEKIDVINILKTSSFITTKEIGNRDGEQTLTELGTYVFTAWVQWDGSFSIRDDENFSHFLNAPSGAKTYTLNQRAKKLIVKPENTHDNYRIKITFLKLD